MSASFWSGLHCCAKRYVDRVHLKGRRSHAFNCGTTLPMQDRENPAAEASLGYPRRLNASGYLQRPRPSSINTLQVGFNELTIDAATQGCLPRGGLSMFRSLLLALVVTLAGPEGPAELNDKTFDMWRDRIRAKPAEQCYETVH